MNSRSCFVMMPFKPEFLRAELLEKAIRPALQVHDLECVEADNFHYGEIPETIREGIRRSVVCIADVTGNNSNVAYELGIAHTLDKTVIMITQDNPDDTSFDVRHWQMLQYSATREGIEILRKELDRRLPGIAKREILRMMLVPPNLPHKNGPFVIAASPLSWRAGRGREGGFEILTNTQVEYVGIKNLFLEFGALYGSDRGPELINPEDYVDEVVKEGMNLFCLASPKSNRWTGVILKKFNKLWKPNIEFKANPNSPDLRDTSVQIQMDGEEFSPIKPTYWHDCGIIIRGPNPFNSEYMFTIIAGRRGTGTEAACRALTDPALLDDIHSKCDLSCYEAPFYVVVKMKRFHREMKYEADAKSIKLIKYGNFTKYRPNKRIEQTNNN